MAPVLVSVTLACGAYTKHLERERNGKKKKEKMEVGRRTKVKDCIRMMARERVKRKEERG